MTSSPIYVGVKGKVIAIDRASGRVQWAAALKGSDFVNLFVDGDRIIATTKGEVFCLETGTGRLLWHNDLPGEGLGLITIATAAGASNPMPLVRAKQQRDEAATTAAIVASS